MANDRSNDPNRKGDASRSKPFGPEHADTVKRVVSDFVPDISKTSGGNCGHCNQPVGDSIHMNILGKHIVSDRIA
jgi:hypothetical protein